MFIKVIVLSLFILSFVSGRSQSASTLIGGRTAGMGYCSSVITDEWSLFNNIGGIGKINKASANCAVEVQPALPGANRMAASFLVPAKIGNVGAGVFRFGDDLYSEQFATLGFGNSIGNTSLGTRANYIQYRAEGFGVATGLSFDFGGVTQITKQISIGASITNLTQSKLNSGDERLPTRLTVGLGFKPSEKTLVVTEIEKDLIYPITWRSGIEYMFYNKIFFRTGFNLNPNASHFGIGFQQKSLKIDFAIRFNHYTGASHQASASYMIHSKRKS